VKQLRRNQMRPKGQPSFVNAPTIMNMPLNDPEKAAATGAAADAAAQETPATTRSAASRTPTAAAQSSNSSGNSNSNSTPRHGPGRPPKYVALRTQQFATRVAAAGTNTSMCELWHAGRWMRVQSRPRAIRCLLSPSTRR
jgi:hypothetical protein